LKVAIPADNNLVSSHFGHCTQFIIYEINKDQKKVESKKTIDNPGHEPGFLPIYLARLDINLIIAGGMGTRAKQLFEENNIQTITGAEGETDKVIQDYLEENLVSKGNYCDH
jgi:predicted Fe-Mo cluster-binding NifX family protein